jgi:septal ring factor EnvC (AmiA/AmiB activator)
MDLAPFVSFFLATVIGLGISIATFLVARGSGLLPIQQELVDVLKDNTAALSLRVAQLEEEVQRLHAQRISLEEQLSRLRTAISDLASENAELRRQLRMPERPS